MAIFEAICDTQKMAGPKTALVRVVLERPFFDFVRVNDQGRCLATADICNLCAAHPALVAVTGLQRTAEFLRITPIPTPLTTVTDPTISRTSG